ncbi:MAG: replicative DNA helicase [Bacteroidales bacterium]
MADTKNTNKKFTKKKKIDVDSIGMEMGLVPPQSIPTEEAVLGSLLIEPDIVYSVMMSLTEECFYSEVNRRIFKAIKNLDAAHSPIDIFTVSEELKKTNSLEFVGGEYYLSGLSNKIGAAAHIDYHVKILVQKYIQRQLISISHTVLKDSFDDNQSVDDLLSDTQEKFFVLAQKSMKKETQKISDVLTEAVDQIEKDQTREDGLSGLASGFIGVDKVTMGWQNSDLIILAARPSVGKTAFVLTMARNMSVIYHTPVAFFSLEMSSTQLAKRLLVSETELSNEKIRGGKKMADHELIQLHEKIIDLAKAPLYIDDTPSLSIYEFKSKARRLVKDANVKIIIIDYLQLMTGPPDLRGMREQEVASISRNLKAVAKELNVPIVALSQLSRAVENRGGSKRPQLSDLRESGSIEQDADIVMFIHRPDYYGLQEDPSQQGKADLIIAKHRNGSTGTVPMKFRKQEAKFLDANDSGIDDNFDMNNTQSYDSEMNNSNVYDSMEGEDPLG